MYVTSGHITASRVVARPVQGVMNLKALKVSAVILKSTLSKMEKTLLTGEPSFHGRERIRWHRKMNQLYLTNDELERVSRSRYNE